MNLTALDKQIAERRADEDFMARIRAATERNAAVLARLA